MIKINKFANSRSISRLEKLLDKRRFIQKNNISIVSEKPSIGAEGYKIIFIHPKSTGGVLVELAEKAT